MEVPADFRVKEIRDFGIVRGQGICMLLAEWFVHLMGLGLEFLGSLWRSTYGLDGSHICCLYAWAGC